MVVDTRTMSELTELERRYWEALRDQDADAAADMTADPCVVAGASGVGAIDRSTFVSMMNDASWRLEGFELTGVDVQQLRDDVAVVAYRVREDLTVEGQPLTLEAADSSVWVRTADTWRCAVHTESILGDPFGRDRQRQ
jgi:ketosteroid isomerase-like protein